VFALRKRNLEPSSRSENETQHLVRRKSAKVAFQAAGQKIKSGFQAAGKAVKKVGAVVAKVALKAAATVGSLASKAVSLVPGVGKAVSGAIKAGTAAANAASDKIHAHMGAKVQRAMGAFNKIQHPMSGTKGAVLDAVLRREEERL
jgi:hypothetical protein